MSKLSSIAPDLTVRQVVGNWPGCATLLEQYPSAKVGGRWTLQELSFFARSENLDSDQLLRELSAIAGVPATDRARPAPERSPVPLLLLALLIALTLGAGWGAGLLLRIAKGADYALVSPASVHIHGLAQLWGWMALFIFATGAHLLRKNTPRPAPPWLDALAAGAITLGVGLFFAQLYPPIHQRWPMLGGVASALMALAALCYVASVGLSLGRRKQRPQRWHWFVLVSAGWLLGWMATDLVIRLRQSDAMLPSDSARHLLIVLPVLGFATNAIYGFGIRLVPGLLNIARLRQDAFPAALVLHNLGLGLLLTNRYGPALIGALAMLAGAVAYLIGMNFLRSKPSRIIFGIDPRGPILIRVAFFWLVAGLVLVCLQQGKPDLPHPFTGAWRHALTVGFITTMILGVGQRLVPVIIKQPLASLSMMRVSAILIVVGNVGRVTLELLTITGWTWTFRWMGITGLLELSAIALFALNLLWTLRNRSHVFGPGDTLRADTRVREAINQRPRLQQDLDDAGVTMLLESPFVAPSLTFGAMALAWGLSPDELLGRLKHQRDHALQPVR